MKKMIFSLLIVLPLTLLGGCGNVVDDAHAGKWSLKNFTLLIDGKERKGSITPVGHIKISANGKVEEKTINGDVKSTADYKLEPVDEKGKYRLTGDYKKSITLPYKTDLDKEFAKSTLADLKSSEELSDVSGKEKNGEYRIEYTQKFSTGIRINLKFKNKTLVQTQFNKNYGNAKSTSIFTK
ncbi:MULTISPECIES: hypothetical protein [Listeria]|uniref:hypothetical protein n=1 Tax=Listeria TaxID=1637 RepID=UPI000B594D05|nr:MULTISPECIES: hypothetical protein [Listeria]